MLEKPSLQIADERGTTLVELMVGLAMGLIVLTALTMVVVVTLHGSTRVSTRVEATQNGRVVLARVTEELHSACIYPKMSPVLAGSTGTKLAFVHAASTQGDAVAPTPVSTEIVFEKGGLKQIDDAWASGTTPSTWTWSNTKKTTTLMTGVAPLPGKTSIFTYYSYLNGGLSELSASPTLSSTNAAKAIEVGVALNTEPSSTPVADADADSSIQDSAVLRLTPPSFNESATALPCQ